MTIEQAERVLLECADEMESAAQLAEMYEKAGLMGLVAQQRKVFAAANRRANQAINVLARAM
jgi:hypothetical protein